MNIEIEVDSCSLCVSYISLQNFKSKYISKKSKMSSLWQSLLYCVTLNFSNLTHIFIFFRSLSSIHSVNAAAKKTVDEVDTGLSTFETSAQKLKPFADFTQKDWKMYYKDKDTRANIRFGMLGDLNIDKAKFIPSPKNCYDALKHLYDVVDPTNVYRNFRYLYTNSEIDWQDFQLLMSFDVDSNEFSYNYMVDKYGTVSQGKGGEDSVLYTLIIVMMPN